MEGADTVSSRKPSLRVEQLPSITMTGFEMPKSNSLLSAIPNGVRRVSGDTSNTAIRPSLNGQLTPSPSAPVVPSPGGPSDNADSPQWSSGVGHATTGGKSGRIIERLMAENDKLHRALREAELKVQALQDELGTFKPRMDALKQENENLSHASSVDSSLLSRRERKIEELKADLAAKNESVARAEALVRQQEKRIEELQEQHSREQQSMADQTKHAIVHAEIMETSHKQLSAEYRARRQAWERDLGQLHEDRDQDRQRMAKLDVVHEQMRLENERQKKVNAELLARWEEVEAAMKISLEQNADATEEARKKSLQMDEVLNQMRWVIGLHKNGFGESQAKKPTRD